MHEYIDNDYLIDELKKTSDKRVLNSLNNKIIFKALDNIHPFKMDIVNTFKVNNKYKREFIDREIYRIFKYHLSIEIEKEKGIKYLNQFFNTKRTRHSQGEREIVFQIIHQYSADIVNQPVLSTINIDVYLRGLLKLV